MVDPDNLKVLKIRAVFPLFAWPMTHTFDLPMHEESSPLNINHDFGRLGKSLDRLAGFK